MGNNVHEEFKKKLQESWNEYRPDEDDLKIPEPDFSFLDNEAKEREVIRPEDMDLGFLEAKRKSPFRRFSKVAVVLIAVLVAGSGTALFLNSNMSYGVKGVIQNVRHAIDPQEQPVMEEDGVRSLEIVSWENIKNAENVISDLYIPEYIPEGYVFDKANFSSTEDGDSSAYEYVKGDEVLAIFVDTNKTNTDVYVSGEAYLSPFSDKQFYLEEGGGTSTVTYLKDEMMYRVSSSLGKEENAKILENIKLEK